jgi:PAT family beta-lactamase induction signal transducer AmpG
MDDNPRRPPRLPVLATVILLGFASGVPLNLIGSSLQAWMADAKVNLATIGFFALAGLPYTFKFLWSPFMDRYRLPFLGKRRGWILVWFLAVMALLAALSRSDPGSDLRLVALLAVALAFASASVDINVDAYRIELLPGRLLGPGVSLHQTSYRLGMVYGGALALFLADLVSWRFAYLVMALGMLPGVAATFLAPEPEGATAAPATLREAVVEPFRDFLGRRRAWAVLAFILLYKLGDNLCVALNTVFLKGLTFSNTEIALANKIVGMGCLIGGALAGGALMARWTLRRSLWVFGVLQMACMTGHLALALVGKSHVLLLVTVAVENSVFAMGSVAYVALIQRCCSLKNAATQFALLTSLAALNRVLFASPAGVLARTLGWPAYFVLCIALAVPGLLLLRGYDSWELPEPAHG